MKKILEISFMVILVAGALFLVSFADHAHNEQLFKSFDIEILNPSSDGLINEKEVRLMVEDDFGRIEGAMISTVNTNDLEDIVRGNPYISACEAYQTIDSRLVMKLIIRSPLVRIINKSGQQYFLDKEGYMVPVSFSHPSHVIVASGNISDRFVSIDKSEKPLSSLPGNSILEEVYPVAKLISGDDFLNSFIDQIYVNEKNELELVPKLGNQQIIFGSSENAEEKLEYLKAFYIKVMSRLDWNTYKVINLKYNNQVVCTK